MHLPSSHDIVIKKSLRLLELLSQLLGSDVENIVLFWNVRIQKIANDSHCTINFVHTIIATLFAVRGQQLTEQSLVKFNSIDVVEREDDHVQFVRTDGKVVITVSIAVELRAAPECCRICVTCSLLRSAEKSLMQTFPSSSFEIK